MGGRQLLTVGENDLLSQRPDIASQLVGLDPGKICFKSGKKVSWCCPQDSSHIWETTVICRTRKRSTGCPFCAGQRPIFGINDLQTLYPKIAQNLFEIDPKTICAYSNKRVWWKCPLGHLTQNTPNNMVKGSHGCGKCAHFGYSVDLPGYIYFARHETLTALQIGISNRPLSRTRHHELRGWTILDVVGPMNGSEALRLETSIRKHLIRSGVKVRSKKSFSPSPMGEAWLEKEFFVTSIHKLFALVN